MADDDKCLRCGRCCYERSVIAGVAVRTSVPCEHLDVGTMLCRVYDRRHEVAPHCASVEDGIELGVFPADCPYVRDVEGYVGPVDVSNLF
jgi:uncharacterized cysteine cluster protein YcgN (CxxCxxCC family)